jgi:hypothetical protein
LVERRNSFRVDDFKLGIFRFLPHLTYYLKALRAECDEKSHEGHQAKSGVKTSKGLPVEVDIRMPFF